MTNSWFLFSITTHLLSVPDGFLCAGVGGGKECILCNIKDYMISHLLKISVFFKCI